MYGRSFERKALKKKKLYKYALINNMTRDVLLVNDVFGAFGDTDRIMFCRRTSDKRLL